MCVWGDGARSLPAAKITVSQARAIISPKIRVANTRLALIPMLSKREVLCYEFSGTYGSDSYIIYVNALNGTEENILKVINVQGGQLSM